MTTSMMNEPIAEIRSADGSSVPLEFRLTRYNGIGSQAVERKFHVKQDLLDRWNILTNEAMDEDCPSKSFKKDLEAFGKRLFQTMLDEPGSSFDTFFGISDRSSHHPLILLVDKNSCKLPWELLHDEDDFLFRKYAVGRVFIGKEFAKFGGYKKGRKALIIAPDSDLERNREEPKLIRKAIEGIGYKRVVIKRRPAEIKGALDKVGLLHYTGHATRTQLDIGRGMKATYLKRKLKDNPPFLAFLNGCETGLGQRSTGLIQSLIDIGVENIICTFWDIEDEASTEFAVRFYRRLKKQPQEDRFLGRALQESRKPMKWRTFPAFYLYGRPSSPPIYEN